MMVRTRSCRRGPSVLLALLLFLLNTLVILNYLGPLNFKNDEIPPRLTSLGQDRSEVVFEPEKVDRIPVVNQDALSEVKNDSRNEIDVFTMWSQKLTSLKQAENLEHVDTKLRYDKSTVSVLGKPPVKPVDIVIGIPTVERSTKDYLSSTLKHLVEYLNEAEKKQCHIVVFTANFEQAANTETANFIKKEFSQEVNVGLIEVIKPDKAFYPKLTNLPGLWKDKPDRVLWRSKQCLDYALLFAYCRKLGFYYLQLEDDVSVSQTYFRDMKNFIQSRGVSKWSNLQFGSSGFIGMLFRTVDLGRLALFVKMYYWIFPVDILFRHYNDIHLYGNSPSDIYRPPLFQHLGRESSLKGQTRKIHLGLDNAKLPVNNRKHKDSSNPSAFVGTNIQVVQSNTIDGPYRTSNLGYFWGKDIHVNDFVLIEFMKEVTLTQVVIETGSEFALGDFLAEGRLEYSGVSSSGKCDEQRMRVLHSSTSHGTVKANVGRVRNVKCVKLTVSKLNFDNLGKPRWLLIREIAVWAQ